MAKINTTLVHLGYWTLFGLLLLTFYVFVVYAPGHTGVSGGGNGSLYAWFRLMLGFAVLPGVLSFYVTYHYLFNRFLNRQRTLAFIAGSLLVALLSAVVGAAFESMPLLFGPAFLFGDGWRSAWAILTLMAAIAWINAMVGAVIRGCLTWYAEIGLKEALRNKHLETELALVKSQIDPHFLFNTLHNIDILIGRDAATASLYLNKLSGIMRFLLYETKGEKIPLEKELDYLQQYIALQSIRTSNADYVHFTITGTQAGQLIAPMLLLPFVENAFKHTEARKSTSRIDIRLEATPHNLLFTCSNTLIAAPPQSGNGGLGNALIRKRLALLYPGTHTLTITNDQQQYHIKLELQL